MSDTTRYVDSDLEAERPVVALTGHQFGCWEVWADMAIEENKISDDSLLAAYLNETADGFRGGRKCHCIDPVTGYYLPDLAEILAAQQV